MRRVFADTLYWLAWSSRRDQWHESAKRAAETLGPATLVTSDEVLTQYLNGMSGAGADFRERAVRIVRRILRNPNIRVLPQTRESFLTALARYESRPDKSYSLTDCASMNAMDAHGIREVLTNDHHFEQEGYTILIRR